MLKHALDELRKRSTTEQDAVAALILDELENERRWDETVARSQDKISELARRAREAADAGLVRNVGWDEL